MTTSRHTFRPAGGRATFRSKGLVLLGTLLILSSMFVYVASRPAPAIASESVVATFEFEGIAVAMAGSEISEVTVTAVDVDGYPVAGYDFTSATMTSTLGNAPVGPGSASAGELVDVDADGIADLVGAIGFEAASGETLTVADPFVTPVTSDPFDVVPGPVASFAFSVIEDLDAGAVILDVTVNAFDAFGNPLTDYDFAAAATVISNLGDAPDGPETADDGDLTGTGTGTISGAVGYEAKAGNYFTVTDTATFASSVSNPFGVGSFAVNPADVDHYSFSTISDVNAGSVIPAITITAYDTYGNIATDYDFSTADVTTDEATDLNGSAIGCGAGAAFACTVPAGTITDDPGTGTATVTGLIGYTAESGRAITVEDENGAQGSSDPFAVKSIEATILTFVNQPIDTKTTLSIASGNPTYSKCIAPAASATDPCSLPVAAGLDFDPTKSQPVRVFAQDRYGNIAITTEIKIAGSNALASVIGTASTNANGVASYPTLKLTTTNLGTYSLTATKTIVPVVAPTAATKPSNPFAVVSDLKACIDQDCTNLAAGGVSGKPQKTLGRITTGDDFDGGGNNVLLTTQFEGWNAGRCVNQKGTLGQTSEVRVQGNGVSPTQPAFYVTLLFPRDTIKKEGLTARSADSFDVCLGATWLKTDTNGTPLLPVVPWTAKNLKTGAPMSAQQDLGNSLRYWGWLQMCPTPLPANHANPCVILKTKQAATLRSELVGRQEMKLGDYELLGMKDADVAIVVYKPWPWDGKFSTGLK